MAQSAESPYNSGTQRVEPKAPVKRFTRQESESVIADLRRLSVDQLDPKFRQGAVPRFNEIEGSTAGDWLAKRAKHWWAQAFIKLVLDSRWGRWSGKGYSTTFDDAARGRGINLFYNRIFPVRYRFKTYVTEAQMDGEPCLRMEYPFGSIMWGLIDDIRRIDEGVFLGQMHFRFPWRRQRIDLGYFVLCALQRE